jgi:hypothetical protein
MAPRHQGIQHDRVTRLPILLTMPTPLSDEKGDDPDRSATRATGTA